MRLSSIVIQIFFNAATSSRQLRTLLTPIGGAVFLAFVGTLIFLALRVDRLIGQSHRHPAPINIVFSLPLLGMGLFLIAWSLFHFLKARGTPVPFNPPPTLVTTGPYAYSRNPMLTGVFALLFGLSVLLPSLSLGLFFTPLFAAISILELKTIEEPELEKRLGKEYVAYRQKTPMFLPRLGSLFK